MSDIELPTRSGEFQEKEDDTSSIINSKSEANLLATQVENGEDADSAPIELLSEFLSAVMSRDYTEALECCKIILSYEPDNEIVLEFYPLIEERLKKMGLESDESSEDEEATDVEDDISSTTNTSDFQDTELVDDLDKSVSSDEDNGWTTALNSDSDSTEKDGADDNANTCSYNRLFQSGDASDICDNDIFNVTA